MTIDEMGKASQQKMLFLDQKVIEAIRKREITQKVEKCSIELDYDRRLSLKKRKLRYKGLSGVAFPFVSAFLRSESTLFFRFCRLLYVRML
jgi:hypothetical protein